MTFKPTKKAQQRWVKKYLNGGELPENEKDYWAENDYYGTACYPALAWLESAKPNITTLAQAWKRCPRPDWLVWCLMQMNPNREDVARALQAAKVSMQVISRSKRDMNTLDFDTDDFEKSKDDLKHIQKLFEGRRNTPKILMEKLMQTYVDVFDYVEYPENSPEAEKMLKKYATIFRRYCPNPWMMK